MLPNNYWLFIQIITILFVTPGPQRVLIISNSMNYGFVRSLWTGIGDISANGIQMILVMFGISTLIKAYPAILDVFKYVGGFYLMYIAFKFFFIKTITQNDKSQPFRSYKDLFKDGFISAFFSPSAIVFFVVIFPTFLVPGDYLIIHFSILMTTHMFLDFFFLIIYAGVANKIAVFLKNYPNFITRISGVVLFLIGIKILLTKNHI